MADRRSCRSALSSSVRTFHAATRICFLFRGTWFWIPLLFCDHGLDTQLAAVSQQGQKELSMFRAPFLAPPHAEKAAMILNRPALSSRQDTNFAVVPGQQKKNTHTHTHARTHTYTHTHPFNGPFSGTTQVSRYQKGKTNLDFNEARDSEWQWHQLGHMQVCT